MSCLKLYAPQMLSVYRGEEETAPDHEDAVVLQFPGVNSRFETEPELDVISRARAIRANRCCPECGLAKVQLLATGLQMFRGQLPAWGTSEVVGFRCNDCQHEWDL